MLSLAELTNYFSSRNIEFKLEYFSREFFVVKFEDSFNQCTCRKKSSGSDSKYKEDIIDAERDRSGIRERAETQRRKLSKDGKGKYIEGS